jgi:ElaB/YqjD/DUF883 family membrane-anchored ribosome-binding protein
MRLSTRKSRNGHDLSTDWLKIKNAIHGTAQHVKGKAEDIFLESVDDIKSKSSMAHKSVAAYTAKKPLKSLGVALLVGMAVGFIFLRRK